MPRSRPEPVILFRLALATGLAFVLLHAGHAWLRVRGRELAPATALGGLFRDALVVRGRGPLRPSGQVVVVAIDERAVEAEGAWPWGRARLARLVDRLADAGASAIAVDVVWSEEDESGRRLARVAALARAAREVSPEAAAGALDAVWAAAAGPDPGLTGAVDPTERLAESLRRAGHVVLGFRMVADRAVAPLAQGARVERLAPWALGADDGDSLADPVRFPGVVTPVGPLLGSARGAGFVTLRADADGTLRAYPAVAAAGGQRFPSLGTALLVASGHEGAAAAALRAADGLGQVPLAWLGPAEAFPAVSAADVLRGRLAPDALRGKVVVVGATAPGAGERFVTPFEDGAPEVLAHATFVENALAGEAPRRPGAALAMELLLMVAAALVLARLFAHGTVSASLAATLAIGAGWIGLAALALRGWGVVLEPGLPVAQVVGVSVVATTWRVVRAERARRRAREAFGRFLAPAVVDEVLAEEGALRPGGHGAELTVLFADLRGFTHLSEQLAPDALLEVLNAWLAPMTDVIVEGHEGTLDKYMGDAVMAFWGAPRPQPDHALRACRAALAMVARLEPLQAAWRARGLPALEVGIGVNTGPVSVGLVGRQDRFFNYTVLGDAVNLASRLEGANREYGTHVLVGAATRQAAGEAVVARALDRVRVKGRREPVVLHELLALAPATELAAVAAAYEAGLAAYWARRFDEAAEAFAEADRLRGGDPPSRVFLARCEALRRAPPPPGWDGVFELPGK
ncbi:MAG: adenylate/guanylate cyclase domain-containing protein [Anaeromyxobacter sp.]